LDQILKIFPASDRRYVQIFYILNYRVDKVFFFFTIFFNRLDIDVDVNVLDVYINDKRDMAFMIQGDESVNQTYYY